MGLIHKSQLNVEGSSSSRAAFKDQKRLKHALPKKVLVTTREKSLCTDFNQKNWMLVNRLLRI